MSTCSEVRDHLLAHGSRDRMAVYHHVGECRACAPLAARVLELERQLAALADRDVPGVPDAWVSRLLAGPELTLGYVPSRDMFSELPDRRSQRSSSTVWSVLAHASCLLAGLAIASYSGQVQLPPQATTPIVFPGTDGGGGGERGVGLTGFAAEEREPTSRAPRPPRALSIDEVVAPELPDDTATLLEDAFVIGAADAPRIPLDGPGGLTSSSRIASSGTGGGSGGGRGKGRGTRDGPGHGDGRGGGSWDVEPALITSGPEPVYPSKAREEHIEGEVILQIRVRVDGSTEVVRVLKSLRYCVGAARASALGYRWRPALRAGRPVEALGVLTVRFEILPEP